MTFAYKLMATTFLLGSFVMTPAFAQTTIIQTQTSGEVVTDTTTRTVRPLAIDGKTKEVKPAIQRFLERVNMARVSLSLKDPVQAKFDLDEAEKHLNFIKQNSHFAEISKQTVIASGKVVSETQSAYNSYYIPLEEGPVVVKSLEATDSQKGKSGANGLAVTSADVVYLNVDLAGSTASDYLTKARIAIKEADLKAADEALGEMIQKITYKEVVDTVPLEKARGNLQLALKFLQDDNYKASRYALEHARDALKDAGNSNAGEVGQIHDVVMQQTPAAAQKARTQIIAVLNKLGESPAK